MRWPWRRLTTTGYAAARAALIDHLEYRQESTTMRDLTAAKTEFHEAGSLRPSWLPETRGGQQLVAPSGASHEVRQERLVKLEAARRAWDVQRAKLEQACRTAAEETERRRRGLDAAQAHQADADRALLEARADHDALELAAGRFLRETSDPLIDDVVLWLRDQLDGLRRAGAVQVTERTGALNPITLLRPRTSYSNVESVERRRRAIQAELVTWENCRELAIEPAELRARAEALPASLPAVDGSITVPMAPLVTPAEARELAWRQAEQEAQR
jgi:hypothetical protein